MVLLASFHVEAQEGSLLTGVWTYVESIYKQWQQRVSAATLNASPSHKNERHVNGFSFSNLKTSIVLNF